MIDLFFPSVPNITITYIYCQEICLYDKPSFCLSPSSSQLISLLVTEICAPQDEFMMEAYWVQTKVTVTTEILIL